MIGICADDDGGFQHAGDGEGVEEQGLVRERVRGFVRVYADDLGGVASCDSGVA